MAIRNSFTVYINGVNYTSRAVMPLKWANFLDERLDECYLSLRNVKQSTFAPLTPVEIHLSNALSYFGHEWNETTKNKELRVKYFIIANDEAQESLTGRGYYHHELYLIEVTKILECIAVETITFTNTLKNGFHEEEPSQLQPEFEHKVIEGAEDESWEPHTPERYVSPLFLEGKRFCFASVHTIFPYEPSLSSTWDPCTYSQKITDPKGRVYEQTCRFMGKESEKTNKAVYMTLESGTYIAEYEMIYYIKSPSSSAVDYRMQMSATYEFSVFENKLAAKSWTISDVIERTLQLAEPLHVGETPRIRLNAAQREEFDRVPAPEFSFTKQTLRECLQQIGSVIHAEPRLKIVEEGEAEYAYELVYDVYGGTERCDLARRRHSLKSVSRALENFASHLDSNVENLVNSLDRYSGVIVEPFGGGFQSVRTEQQYVRITDSGMLISTRYPIYTVKQLICRLPSGEEADITLYLFEASVYRSRLSSFSTVPISKAYALYYTQGGKNIEGLSFKVEAPSDIQVAYSKYAIVNILRQVLKKDPEISETDYPKLAFRVTYTPISNARVSQTKPYYPDTPRAAALIVNQQANIVETRYFGENLKGLIARIGNVEQSITYILPHLYEIPRAGDLYNDDYYVAGVSVEFLPSYIKCTVALSKDLNRLSQYIAIPSERRFSEVSEGQASERSVLYREYVVIRKDDSNTHVDADSLIGDDFLKAVAETLTGKEMARGPVTCVVAQGYTYAGYHNDPQFGLTPVVLPVVSSAFGNSVSFSWEYTDNYSAGPTSEYGEYDESVSGYFQGDCGYTDNYGRIWYYEFGLKDEISWNSSEDYMFSLPSTSGLSEPTFGKYKILETLTPFILRKDSREALQVNVQVDFVTDWKGLIIGSALAAYNVAVRGHDASLAPRLYVFSTPIGKFTERIAYSVLKNRTGAEISMNEDAQVGMPRLCAEFPEDGVAWAIVTASGSKDVDEETDDGTITITTRETGGEILLACNETVTKGDPLNIYLVKRRKIYDDSPWVRRT